MNRKECLTEAEKCICTDRNEQYGEPEDNFKTIAELWEIYLGFKGLNASDVANMMILFKVARNITAKTPKADTYIDIAGYAACGCEIATKCECDTALEHDGCNGCKHELAGTSDYPCRECKGTVLFGTMEYKARKDYWEGK